MTYVIVLSRILAPELWHIILQSRGRRLGINLGPLVIIFHCKRHKGLCVLDQLIIGRHPNNLDNLSDDRDLPLEDETKRWI
jgi:hypothetical protein